VAPSGDVDQPRPAADQGAGSDPPRTRFADAVAALAGPVTEARYTGKSFEGVLDDVGHIDRQMAFAALSEAGHPSAAPSGQQAKVDGAVREAMRARSKRTGITADRVLRELAELAFSNIFDFLKVHSDGSVSIDLSRGTRDQAAAIHDVVVKGYAEGSGEEAPKAKLTRIAMCDKLKALELLARHLGMLPVAGRRTHRRHPDQLTHADAPR